MLNNIDDDKKTENDTDNDILNRLKYRKLLQDDAVNEHEADGNSNDIQVKIDYYKGLIESFLITLKKPKTIIYIVFIFALIIGIYIYSKQENNYAVPNGTSADSLSSIMSSSDVASTGEQLYVEVSGQVKNPTVLTMKSGARVFQAIELAGGLKKNADTSALNLVQLLTDGQKIYVPKKGETTSSGATGSTSNENSSGSADNNGKVNLNTASSEELQTISGVGPSTAQKILDYREQSGSFKSVDDLLNVSGIGEKTLEKLKPYVYV